MNQNYFSNRSLMLISKHPNIRQINNTSFLLDKNHMYKFDYPLRCTHGNLISLRFDN